MTILFRPQGAFGWFSYTTSRDTIDEKAWSRLSRICFAITEIDHVGIR